MFSALKNVTLNEVKGLDLQGKMLRITSA